MTDFQSFHLPESVSGTQSDVELGRGMIRAWRTDGVFRAVMNETQNKKSEDAFAASRRFFEMPMASKTRYSNDLTYSGYTASGEEVTAGERDYPEVFTICKDIPADDARAQANWPCHGPVPWPDAAYRASMRAYMEELGSVGDKLLQLIALGLGLNGMDALTALTRDGWHHLRALRYPAADGESTRGLGSHTDYGLIVMTNEDDVGGLSIRPPVEGEKRNRNWLAGESTAGMYEKEGGWIFCEPKPNVLTVLAGDILQFITNNSILATMHKVALNTRERFSMAYFHEPNFGSSIVPLAGPSADPSTNPPGEERLFYGEHFTHMFMRCYPDGAATRRIVEENRLSVLADLKNKVLG
uniref:2-oxoglutarate-dependent ethylene/succinate-forming enzyme n=1 Tax=Candidatus Kentrum sp. FM TaxID=2126340 RepID=A0A450TGA0_9GAMM|nr:MAG: Isopenicillin N synthase [Candidatus Kentron sp. FM]VFJ66229.1 MAG: Isopenicillin N synthase [Candidatus Kentron sp. FM]VFK11789.1 MAG: Isopenicillin N synthase [Candidatus Kentron sp. FM]